MTSASSTSAFLVVLIAIFPATSGTSISASPVVKSVTASPSYAGEVVFTTTNLLMIYSTPVTSNIVPTTTTLPPVQPKPNDYFSFDLIRKWILKHPIITGLSAAVIILSLLLLCMCYLWLCKRRKRIIYYVVGDSELDEKEEREENEEGEVHCNPDATNPDIKDPDTEDDVDSGISGEGKSTRAGNTDHPPVQRRISAPVLNTDPSVAAASVQVVLELKAAQEAATELCGSSQQETALVTIEPQPNHREMDADDQRSDPEIPAEYEEIPSLDSLTFDWQADLPATFSSSVWVAAQNSGASLILSEISDIA